MKTKRNFKSPQVLLLFLIFLTLLGVLYSVKKKADATAVLRQNREYERTGHFLDRSKDNAESYIEDADIEGLKRYISPKLGVSFEFNDFQGGSLIRITEKENKIYIYGEDLSYDMGQYVEVFDKNPANSVQQEIESRFLEGFSSEECEYYEQALLESYPNTYKMVNIRVKGTSNMQEVLERYENCPSTYTESNGISYFLADDSHSNRILFVNIGQYPIFASSPSQELRTWQDTIKFLD